MFEVVWTVREEPQYSVHGFEKKLVLLEDVGLDTWYKDEGGNSNRLSVLVGVEGGTVEKKIQLHCTVHYQRGVAVEDRDQRMLNLFREEYDESSHVLTPSEPTCRIEFRFEKVSRRKDNQRFCLRVDGEEEDGEDVEGVRSSAVLVMSKRRTGERTVSRRSGSSRAAGQRAAASFVVADDVTDLEMKIDMLIQQQSRMASTLTSVQSMLSSFVASIQQLQQLPQFTAAQQRTAPFISTATTTSATASKPAISSSLYSVPDSDLRAAGSKRRRPTARQRSLEAGEGVLEQDDETTDDLDDVVKAAGGGGGVNLGMPGSVQPPVSSSSIAMPHLVSDFFATSGLLHNISGFGITHRSSLDQNYAGLPRDVSGLSNGSYPGKRARTDNPDAREAAFTMSGLAATNSSPVDPQDSKRNLRRRSSRLSSS